MKRLYTILIFILSIIITSCEDKHNHIGDLNGNWQLTSWVKTNDGTIIADKNSGIYYSISISLIKIKKTIDPSYYIATFRSTNDSLIFSQVYYSNSVVTDSIVQFQDLHNYGVTDNGSFHIASLSSTKLVLMNDENTLTFRRN